MTSDDNLGGTPLHSEAHPAVPLFNLLGKAHTMHILHKMVKDEPRPWRFTELQDTIGISPNTLSKRLAELTDRGFIDRRQYDEIPPRVEYEATAIAKDLAPVFEQLSAWAHRHDLVQTPDSDD